ncbi:peptidoglycan-associated lipoprotein Pal [Oceanibacterium hippocampi]|uniref:Peptidoglycan-associated lipoprotein n=1 Tax=Oceanibacterium hippocampi TaxID=745714 RepID=A0A1Y5TVR2_9PROT|nr:peptidoglycan-associated lipoprotein Pal [Oceanibacterium hippocampi]SLN73311.1 Outer membrane lipoprotein Omp16 precursor [Oceanibacterium hippocampi]
MRLDLGIKIIGAVAALLLVAACETAPTDSAGASGEGASTQGSGTATQSTTTTATEPAGPRPGTQEDLVLNVGDRVFFDLDRYDLTPEARDTLQRQAAWLAANPQVTLTVEGHADERGTREYNLALGDRRATSVKNYLVNLGVDPARLSTISYGKERPVALGSNEAAWAQNRRGVAVVN